MIFYGLIDLQLRPETQEKSLTHVLDSILS